MRVGALLVLAGLWFYVSYVLFRCLRDERVPHRWYFLEKNRGFDYATRRRQPIEYWLSLILQFLLWALISWTCIHYVVWV
jgi:hypothetical protein